MARLVMSLAALLMLRWSQAVTSTGFGHHLEACQYARCARVPSRPRSEKVMCALPRHGKAGGRCQQGAPRSWEGWGRVARGPYLVKYVEMLCGLESVDRCVVPLPCLYPASQQGYLAAAGAHFLEMCWKYLQVMNRGGAERLWAEISEFRVLCTEK